MTPPINIDGSQVSGVTIDGTDVSEVTVDGSTVFGGIPDSPVYRWILDEDSGPFVDEIGGVSATNNGTTQVTGTWVNDAAREGDGSSAYIDTSTLPNFSTITDTDFAVAFTIRTTQSSGHIMGLNEGAGGQGFQVRTGKTGGGGSVELYIQDPSDGGTLYETTSNGSLIDDGNKHRVVINKTSNGGGGIAVSVDDTDRSMSTSEDSGFGGTTEFVRAFPLFASKRDGSLQEHMAAVLDDVIFFDDALSAQQITDDYNRQPWS